MLFAAHPLQVETVAWASGAKDLLLAMFSLVVIWQYACFRESNAKGKVHYAIALLAMLLAMLAKPSAMVTPVILLILDRLVFGQSWKEAIRSLWPFVVIRAAVDGDRKTGANEPRGSEFTDVDSAADCRRCGWRSI